uniref:39S ribosomal protein L37, mitochondrial n=1 Tax=Steinernema glaseri TaxID=37863 RepID=A0A1I7ZCS1_9BILA
MLSRRVVSSVRFASSATSSAAVVKDGGKPVKPPTYRRTLPGHKPLNMLQEEFPNQGDATGHGPRLYDYHDMAEKVRSLPTATEKIEFVNPYEREWNSVEKTWRRQWHPQLMAPRKAWNVPSIPRYFDSLDFYKYITKCRVETENFDRFYKGIVPPTKKFEARLLESLDASEASNSVDLPEAERANRFLRNVIDDAMISLAHNVELLQEYRLSHSARCESFWIRSGFLSMYDKKEIGSDTVERKLRYANRFIGDDRRKLGELSFVLRDELAAQLRSTKPLRQLFDLTSEEATRPVFDEDVKVEEDIIFSPKVFNMWPDKDVLWQCPGYDSDSNETHKYGRLAIKDMSALNTLSDYWKVEGEEAESVRRDAMTACAVSSLFSWLNAQAHCLGYTQYTDLDRPLVSQLVLTDGNEFFFALAQLNTLAINIDVDGFVNDRSNVCFVDGPHPLFVEEKETGEGEGKTKTVKKVNQHVLSRILQMVLKE